MGKLQDLMKIVTASTYGATYAEAKATGKCIRCKKTALKFRDAAASAEYAVSALCQECQDECFRGFLAGGNGT